MKALLKDPKLVYDYQNNLVSTKAEVKKDESQLREIEKYLNALPNKKDKIIIQHRE